MGKTANKTRKPAYKQVRSRSDEKIFRNYVPEEDLGENFIQGSIIAKDKSKCNIHTMTEGQEELFRIIRKNQVTLATGAAGTGKTFIAVAVAVDMLRNNEIDKIILCRPPIETGKSLGYLPGELNEKIQPYQTPFTKALSKLLSSIEAKKLEEGKKIEMYPLGFMRGDTLDDAFVILDEAQNCTKDEIKMFLTRLGKNTKYVITGDTSQVDLGRKSDSGLGHAIDILTDIKGIGAKEMGLADIVRSRIVKEIIHAYDMDSN